LAHGHQAKAITLFERALRYAPDNPSAVSGLARSLLAAGRAARALDLMARAVELAEKKGTPAYDAVLSLARALADSAADLPHAVARLRTIPAGEPQSLDARGLEGRYRATLGDLAGASIAFGHLRETIEVAKEVDRERAAAWLIEAARFESNVKRDALAAQRHLAVALELLPRDGKILAMFREAAAKASGAPGTGATDTRMPVRREPREMDGAVPGFDESAADEERAVTLSDRLRGDPRDHSIALELADVLARLGRDLELFALLSARLEDADEGTRPDLVPRQQAVLRRLIEDARIQGRADDLHIYSGALERLRATT
jgi:thioredoxin-like negative regulator of GroEL